MRKLTDEERELWEKLMLEAEKLPKEEMQKAAFMEMYEKARLFATVAEHALARCPCNKSEDKKVCDECQADLKIIYYIKDRTEMFTEISNRWHKAQAGVSDLTDEQRKALAPGTRTLQ